MVLSQTGSALARPINVSPAASWLTCPPRELPRYFLASSSSSVCNSGGSDWLGTRSHKQLNALPWENHHPSTTCRNLLWSSNVALHESWRLSRVTDKVVSFCTRKREWALLLCIGVPPVTMENTPFKRRFSVKKPTTPSELLRHKDMITTSFSRPVQRPNDKKRLFISHIFWETRTSRSVQLLGQTYPGMNQLNLWPRLDIGVLVRNWEERPEQNLCSEAPY